MAFQPAEAGVIGVTFKFTLFGIPIAIVVNVRINSHTVPTGSQVANVCSAAEIWFRTDVMPNLSKDLILLEVIATDLSTETGFQSSISEGSGIIGGQDSTSMPSQVAVVVTLRTALRGRSYRGRSYIPGIPTSFQTADSNVMSALGTSDIFSSYGNFSTHLTSVDAKQVVLSRSHGLAKRPVALAQEVTGSDIKPTFETQRRRGATAHR